MMRRIFILDSNDTIRNIEDAAEKAHAERILAIKASVMTPDPMLDFPF